MMDRFRVTLARWASNVHTLLVQGRGAGDIPADAVEVYQPQGLRSVPVPRAETEALVIELANGERLALLIDKKRDGAVVPEAGETQVHGLSQPAAVIRVRASGKIEVTPLAGQDVVLAGGSLEVARRTDPVTASAGLLTTLGQIVTLLNTPGPVVGAAGAVTPFSGTVGTITGGAPNVKA